MEIKEVDKNLDFIKKSSNGKLIDAKSDLVSHFGHSNINEQGFFRMPTDFGNSISANIGYLSTNTSGIRVAFRTNTKNITLHVEYDFLEHLPHMAQTGSGGFVLSEVVKGNEKHAQTFVFPFDSYKGYTSSSHQFVGRKYREFVLYFPLYNQVKNLYIEIDKSATIEPFNPYKDIKPILYYGSSITQGGCASRTDTSYQAFIAKWNHIDYINLGFSGNCKAELEMAQYISKLDISVFVYDYDYNANDCEYLKDTHERFFKEFRKAKPNTPVIFMTAPSYYTDVKTFKLRRNIIYTTYKNAIDAGDKNVYFVDGKTMYPKEVRFDCAVDGCHPTDLGFYYMAKSVYKVLKKLDNLN